jgi:hypothetical protein
MRRIVLGWLLIVQALAHAGVSTWSFAPGTMWPMTALGTTAFVAYTMAGLGVLRVPGLRRWWKTLVVVAAYVAILALALHPSMLGLVAGVMDVTLLTVVLSAMRLRIDVDIAVVNFLGAAAFRHPRWVRAGWTIGCAWLAYGSVVGAATTHRIARTRTPGEAGAVAFLRAPFDVFVFEPAHLVIESGMLPGSRGRAYRRARAAIE